MSPELLEKIGIPPLIIAIVLLIIWLFEKLPIIFDYGRNKQKEQFEFLETALSTNLTKSERKLLNNIKNQRAFYKATGFNGNVEIRQSVSEIILKSRNKYSLNDFIKIRKFLIFNENTKKLNIEVSKVEWYELTFMRCTFIGLMIWLALSSVILTIFSSTLFKLLATNPSDSLFSLIFLTVFAPIILGILYFPDSERYNILNKIYINDEELLSNERPKIEQTYIIVVATMIVAYSFLIWLQKQL